MRVLLLDIPAPCKFINSNSREHRMATAKLTAIWRNAGTLAVSDENRRRQAAGEKPLQPFDKRVRIVAKIWKKKAGRWDVGNWYPSAKAAVDGIVQAGLIRDDSNEYVLGPDMRVGGTGQDRLIITIEEIE